MERDKKVRHRVKKLLLKCETNVKRGGSVRFLNKASEKEQERENVKERKFLLANICPPLLQNH